MGIRAWMFFTFVFFVVTLLGGFLDMAFSSAELGALERVLQMKVFSMREFDVLFFDFTLPVPNMSWLTDLSKLMTWNFSFFSGDLNIVRWMVWLTITGGLVFTSITIIGPAIFGIIADARRAILG